VFLGITILLFAFNDPSAENSRTQLAGFTAATVVALPVWAVHFWFAGRFARRDAAERTSALRRLYVYFACLITALGGTTALSFTLGHLLAPLLDTCTSSNTPPCSSTPEWLLITQGAWATAVLLGLWAFHIQIALRDRAIAGEQGASATLRRWYMYIALLAGLLTLLIGGSSLIERVWLQAIHSSLLSFLLVSDAAGQAAGGLVLWGFHAWLLSTRYAHEDRQSTLRALEGFIAVANSIAVALFGAYEILYYAVARLIGVSNPGGVGNDVLANLSGPVSAIVVYGTAWVLVRRRLARDAGTEEAARQAAIRRLYTNLAALVSLAAFAIGVGGVLWHLAELIEAPLIGISASDWRDPISKYASLAVVGAVVWFAHWRPAPWAADRQSLSRKLYLWAALLASVLAVLGYGIFLLYAVLQQAFQPHPRLDDPSNLDFGHYLAAVLVAVVVGVYHWRVMRADSAARPARAEIAAPPATATPAAPTALPAGAPASTSGRRFVLSVVGATEDDVHQALAALPPQATYKLTSADAD
jgi:hypothetical protein